MQNYRISLCKYRDFSLYGSRVFPNFYTFAVYFNHSFLKYLTATFHIVSEPSLLQTARDLLADCAGDAGFESFEDTDDGIKGYVQEEQFDKEQLDAQLADFPLPRITVTYELSKVEDQDWNETWENEGFDAIGI